jgi:cytochrome c biogenesis protein CcmG/thiol:disulfide interchange protein DsbE
MFAIRYAIPLLGLALVAVAQQAAEPSPFLVVPGAAPDQLRFIRPLADFEAKDLRGRIWNKASLLGHITVVNIWATWCMPCRKEHPMLQRFYQEATIKNTVRVVTVNIDEDPDLVKSYLIEKGIRSL